MTFNTVLYKRDKFLVAYYDAWRFVYLLLCPDKLGI